MVKPKKYLGQHFLKDQNIAKKIVAQLQGHGNYTQLLEIGPGTGVLTKIILENKKPVLFVSEIDKESIAYLKAEQIISDDHIFEEDFLKMDLGKLQAPLGIIGNFPYNISSQIFFKVLDHRDKVTEVVCMIQKEVAERLNAAHGNKQYGKLSVLLQAFYTIDYCFTVSEKVFHPPPKVKSAVIRLKRNDTKALKCDESMFFRVVKQGFQNRRKTLRNALKSFNLPEDVKQSPVLDKRAEQLTVSDFESLTYLIQSHL